MERYDYLEAMKADIQEYIDNVYSIEDTRKNLANRDEWESDLYDELWVEDSVTGNASGSYYCNAWKAEEAIAHNLDLLAEAMQEFCCDVNALEKGAESCDVTIRCYLLGVAISLVLDEIESDLEE